MLAQSLFIADSMFLSLSLAVESILLCIYSDKLPTSIMLEIIIALSMNFLMGHWRAMGKILVKISICIMRFEGNNLVVVKFLVHIA